MKERSYALLMGSVSSLLTKINIKLILQGPCFVKSIFKVSSFHSDLEMYNPWKKIPNKKIMLYAFFYMCETQFSNINDFTYSNDTCEVPKFVFILKYFWIEVSFHIQHKPFLSLFQQHHIQVQQKHFIFSRVMHKRLMSLLQHCIWKRYMVFSSLTSLERLIQVISKCQFHS